jgi:hypothetical protein
MSTAANSAARMNRMPLKDASREEYKADLNRKVGYLQLEV